MQQATSSYSQSIAVVTVNYGTADLAAEAVRSALRQTVDGFDVEIHLVDNASPGDDAAKFTQLHKAEAWSDRVTLYLEAENHGFGRGNNVALNALATRENPPQYVLLLNPDAMMQDGALAALVQHLEATPSAGSAGAQISKPNVGPVSAAFRFPTAMVEFVSAANIGPITRASGNKTLWMAADLATQQVDWVAGAAVMFRMKALEETGFFDPDFFLYFEEVELMWRLTQKGWPCWFVSEAKVIHVEGAATEVRSEEDVRSRKPAYWYNSRAMYYQKTSKIPGAALGRAFARLTGSLIGSTLSFVRPGKAPLPKNFYGDYMRHTVAPILGFANRGTK